MIPYIVKSKRRQTLDRILPLPNMLACQFCTMRLFMRHPSRAKGSNISNPQMQLSFLPWLYLRISKSFNNYILSGYLRIDDIFTHSAILHSVYIGRSKIHIRYKKKEICIVHTLSWKDLDNVPGFVRHTIIMHQIILGNSNLV